MTAIIFILALLVPPYDRDAFGGGWADLDRDGCSTRQEVLARDLTQDRTVRKGRCRAVVSGVLSDPYGGAPLLVRDASREVQIDHVVALKDAWVSGAYRWSPEKRRRFANDPRNLLAVPSRTNSAKGSRGPAEVEELVRAGRCRYAKTYAQTKRNWKLATTPTDVAALRRALRGCPR